MPERTNTSVELRASIFACSILDRINTVALLKISFDAGGLRNLPCAQYNIACLARNLPMGSYPVSSLE